MRRGAPIIPAGVARTADATPAPLRYHGEDFASPPMEPSPTQQIRFCASHDGTRIAYATSGAGAPLVKASHVLLRFTAPGAAETLAQAQRLARDLDADFLWEASGDGEFGFDDLARDYYGAAPAP